MDNRIIELETKIKDITNELTELKTELEEVKKEQQKSRRWKPQVGEIYYSVNGFGEIATEVWRDHPMDEDRYAMGNCYPTFKDGELEVEKKKVIAEMKEFEEGPEREWNINNFHYYIFYSVRRNKIEISHVCNVKDNNIFFESKEKAQECIDKIGIDRIKRFYLRVED